MKKTVYSLVLSEDVIEAVDRMAYSRGTSRSNLINQILAEAVGYVTPERRMAEILQTLSAQMTGLYQHQEQATDGILVIRSPLRSEESLLLCLLASLCSLASPLQPSTSSVTVTLIKRRIP